MNAAIFPLITTNLQTEQYIIKYGNFIYTSMLVTSVMQYLMPLIGIISFYGLKKQAPRMMKLYPVEQKYAIYLNTICTCFFYGIN